MENSKTTVNEVMDAIENEAKNEPDNFTLTLEPALVFEGKTYTKLEFNFNTLTGADFINISNELAARNRLMISPTFSPEFISIMCAKACTITIGADLLQAMPLRQFNRLWTAGRNFLLR